MHQFEMIVLSIRSLDIGYVRYQTTRKILNVSLVNLYVVAIFDSSFESTTFFTLFILVDTLIYCTDFERL